jgi:hypothetical protein
MNANELADAMETRASIRRKAVSRKSVQENANDRLADQLEQAATMLRQQQAEIEALKKEKWLTEIDCKQQALKQVIDMLTIHHDTLACSSYPMSKENRK